MAAGDRQTYTRLAATVEAAMVSWVASMLASTISMPKDGPKITADNDAAGKSPVNIGLKDLANLITGLGGSLFGNIGGVTQRSLKSFYVDGTGGVTHAVTGGYGQALTAFLVGAVGAIRATLDTKQLSFSGTVASGSNPAGTVAGANVLDALMIPKAWVRWETDGVGGITYSDGGRITSVQLPGASKVKINFATGFDSTVYTMSTFVWDIGTNTPVAHVPTTTALGFTELTCGLDPAGNQLVGMQIFFGRQTT